MTKMKCLGALGLMLAACGGQAESDGGTTKPDQSALKKAAAESVANGTATSDPCAANGWYGDNVCDTFCQDKDTDCVPKAATPTVCAEFIEAPNGICSRKADDPCIFQDPDCNQATPPHPTPGGPGSVVCAEFSEAPDGVCSRPSNDPCQFQDPDCRHSVAICPTIEEEPDGKCSLPASDPCQGIDPDCVVVTTGSDGGAGDDNGAGSSSSPPHPTDGPGPSGSAGAGSSTPVPDMGAPPCCKP
jgi:hypothetical protein